MKFPSLPQWVYDATVMTVASVHLMLVIDVHNQPVATLAIVAVAALLFRRQAPFVVLLVTLPPAAWVGEKVASMFALYALAHRSRRLWVTVVGVLLLTACFIIWNVGVPYLFMRDVLYETSTAEWTDIYLSTGGYFSNEMAFRESLYYLLVAGVPAILGYLQQSREDLSFRLREVTEAREYEQMLLTQQALAAERAQLAREMHDVVSHQVSLIAVQAGALQMQSKDSEVKDSASTIRRLSVKTLEELRHMVKVLRASGVKTTELTPQPTIAQLEELVGGSGIEAELSAGPLPELEPPLQRAIYRTVQESLTNVRKHAPGARASVRVEPREYGIEVEVVNGPAERAVLDLPGSRHGLMGLRQRAELLGGRLDYGPTDDRGWRVRLSLPVAFTSVAQ